MGEATQDVPKCFVTLGGEKLINWQKSALSAAGIDEVVAIGGYRANLLSNEIDVPFVNRRWSETSSVASLRAANHLLAESPAVVVYSDIVFHPDHVTALLSGHGDLRITYDLDWLELWRLRAEDPLLDAETFAQEDGWLTNIGDKPDNLDQIAGQYMGLLYITPAAWGDITGFLSDQPADFVDRLDLTGLMARMLELRMKIGVVPVHGKWCETDTENDRRLYESLLNAPSPWHHDWRWIDAEDSR